MVWKINREAVTVLGGGRALLMQVANPSVAAGVIDHSDFGVDAFARLWRTLDTVLSVAFGDSGQAAAAAERVAGVHASVQGERSGATYSALDPELLLWVHATLVDTALLTYERFVGPLRQAERERYYEEMKRFAAEFGLAEADLPPDLWAFDAYLKVALAGFDISMDARRLAPGLLRPSCPWALAPASALMRFVTVGLLPAGVREGFALAWSPVRERALGAFEASVRAGLPLLPGRLRWWPHAVQAGCRSVANVP